MHFLELKIWKVKLKAIQTEEGTFLKVFKMKFKTWAYITASDLTLLKQECSHLICELQMQEHLIHKDMLLYSLLNLEA